MNIEDVIKSQWENTAALIAVIPAASVSTGEALANDDDVNTNLDDAEDALPMARIMAEFGDHESTNSVQSEIYDIRIEATLTTNLAANSVRSEIVNGFHRKSWSTASEHVVLSTVESTEKEQLTDGNWRVIAELEVRAHST